jgi:hypothetical protein
MKTGKAFLAFRKRIVAGSPEEQFSSRCQMGFPNVEKDSPAPICQRGIGQNLHLVRGNFESFPGKALKIGSRQKGLSGN